jgi:hypothetical protein
VASFKVVDEYHTLEREATDFCDWVVGREHLTKAFES